MKHYLVTGAAGFIGSHLAEQLLMQEDIMVTGIDNFDDFYPRHIKESNLEILNASGKFHFIEGDIRSDEWQKEIREPLDAIVHIAAKAGVIPSIADPLQYEEVNVKGTYCLLEFARRNNISQFVFASSSSIYGMSTNFPWKENDAVMKPVSPYAATKVAAELAGYTYSFLHNIRFIALRFFTVYGPRQRPDLAIHRFTENIWHGKPVRMFGDGSTRRDYTYVSDITTGIMAAINYRSSMYEIINLGNNKPVYLRDLIQTIESELGRKAVIEQLPEQPGDVPVTFADISKAEQLLGYRPKVSLQEGIRAFCQWYLEKKS
jgi:UDP-glucuronate 4-epimerase